MEDHEPSENSTLIEKLEANGLGIEETLDRYSQIIRDTTNESLRKNALDTVLKMHGVLKETAAPPPSFTIIIQDSPAAGSPSADNDIISKLPAGVNPILLPRQLLNNLPDRKEAN